MASARLPEDVLAKIGFWLKKRSNYGGGWRGGKNERDDQFILSIVPSSLFDYPYIAF
jgi:hypothetical protein